MISLPHQPKIIEKKGNWARFEISGLWPGYGVTIGNSLRRVLLSSLSGAAVTQMKIKGIPHEFSTIPGILEDAVSIMQNLKQLRLRVYSDEPQKAYLKAKGIKEVKGSDFKFPATVELINKNVHIATLTGRAAELDMEIQIEKGIGYSSRETRKKEKLEMGTVPVDAIFTPVKRISYNIENMRIGERTDFNRLFLEIETDGTIGPETAFAEASEILVKHFSLLGETFKKEEKVLPAEVPTKRKWGKVKKVKHEKTKKRKKT